MAEIKAAIADVKAKYKPESVIVVNKSKEVDDEIVLDTSEGDNIREVACQEKYLYRHKWSIGDLVVWDNRSVQHYAEHGYGDANRTMHRLTTSGSKPF